MGTQDSGYHIGCETNGYKKSSFTSEYRNQFKNSCLSSYRDNYERAISHGKSIASKELYERGNVIVPTNIPTISTYRSDYHPNFKPEPIGKPFHEKMFKFPVGFSMSIDPNSNSFKKYLDIYATTHTLDFRNHMNNDVEQDAITTWDWFKVPKVRGKSLEINFPICESNLDTAVQFKRTKSNRIVPNRGLLSEQQEEFSYKSLTDPGMPDV